MRRKRSTTSKTSKVTGKRKSRPSLREIWLAANKRAHEQANRKMGKRGLRSIRAAIAETDIPDTVDPVHFLQQVFRILLGLLLLPFCWVTSWTLLSRFSHATIEQGFWQAPSFWYFTIGAFFMLGWFWSGLAKSFFLYLYVLGHELTHAAFVKLCFGRVTDLHVSLEGGYITTNKTNVIIALSPYFVPFWSIIVTVIYAVARFGFDVGDHWDLSFYALIGATWTFHFVWTVWMIPRDQPDLRQNGTFLSLVIIYQANLIILAALLCLAEGSPMENAVEFGREWLRVAASFGVQSWDWIQQNAQDIHRRILLHP